MRDGLPQVLPKQALEEIQRNSTVWPEITQSSYYKEEDYYYWDDDGGDND